MSHTHTKTHFWNREFLLVTLLRIYGNTAPKQRGIQRMWKPAILNSYLGEEGTTVEATVYHTHTHTSRERERERAVAVGSADVFDSEEKRTFFKRLPEDKQHSTSSSTVFKWLKPGIFVSRRSATSHCSVVCSFYPIDGGHSCYGGEAAGLRGGLHQESPPGRQPAQRPSPADHAEGRGALFTVAKLLQVRAKRNCAQNEESCCHLDVRG